MTVRYYSSLDAGAPVLSTASAFAQIRDILLACLVNGYGAKPAAGWSLIHQLSSGFSITNGPGSGVANIVNYGGNTFDVYLMEAVTDTTTALASGVNRRSGAWYDGSSNANRQRFYQWTNDMTNKHWHVIADERTAILKYGSGFTSVDAGSVYAYALYLGDYDNSMGFSGAGQFCCLGGSSDGTSTRGLGASMEGTALRVPFTNMPGQGDIYGCLPARNRSAAGIASLGEIVVGKLYPTPVFMQGSNGRVGGRLRGLISEPTLGCSTFAEVCTYFGLQQAWQSRVKLISMPNGDSWAPIFPNTSMPGMFASMDPVYWG